MNDAIKYMFCFIILCSPDRSVVSFGHQSYVGYTSHWFNVRQFYEELPRQCVVQVCHLLARIKS